MESLVQPILGSGWRTEQELSNKILCIIPCGNKKIWDKYPEAGPTKAKDVYIGPFAQKCKEYAEKFYPSSWSILSAKYGFLFQDDIVPGPYNLGFNDKKSNSVIVLGGRNYTEIIKIVFETKDIYTPLSNCRGIGIMMGKLNEAIKRGIPYENTSISN